MTVAHIEILVEEYSMEVVLRILVPKIVGNLSFNVYPYQGKQDLLNQLPARLRGYRKWLPDDWRVVVVMDRDDDDCTALKKRLEGMATQAGLISRTRHRRGNYQVANRLAIEELEAWYFGDWHAVVTAYPRLSTTIAQAARYRNPDAIRGGTCEALERILLRAGYFRGGLRKIEAARAIAPHLVPARNTSRSFAVLHQTLDEMRPPSPTSPPARRGFG